MQVKLTFQVPVVVGPKSATPPLTPTRSTPPPYTRTPPPIPPHVPLRIPLTPAGPPSPHERTGQKKPDLVYRTTGESRANLAALLSRYMFAVMYLTFSGQSENSRVSTVTSHPMVGTLYCVRCLSACQKLYLRNVSSVFPGVVFNNLEQTFTKSGCCVWLWIYWYSHLFQSWAKCSASIHSSQHCH